MPIIKQTALVSYSAKQMYELVNNYERYPEFVPGCVASHTLSRSEKELTAELVISKAGIKQKFTTHNTMEKFHCVNIKLLRGPFKFLHGQWLFDEIDEKSCKVNFNLEFEFANALVGLVFGKIFNELTAKMLDSFKSRAKEIYHG